MDLLIVVRLNIDFSKSHLSNRIILCIIFEMQQTL